MRTLPPAHRGTSRPRAAQARKDVAQIFNAIMRRSVGGKELGVLYMEAHRELIPALLHGRAPEAHRCAALRRLRADPSPHPPKP